MKFSQPVSCYAAWSNDTTTRFESASGGVAAELYRYAIKSGFLSVGVCWSREQGAFFIPVTTSHDIEKVRNSKYVFSNTNGIYCLLKNELEMGKRVLFIGLPCQVAGLYGYLKKDYEQLTTVDIICHGVAPSSYLDQHLAAIERKKRRKAEAISFRTPKYYTYTFTFTFTDKNNIEFYKNSVKSVDNYQLGYHHSLIYRENCYQCKYARGERLADMTIGDFSGLGRYADCNYDRHNVSCILINTQKGAAIVESLNDVVTLDPRPLDEALKVEKQLQQPSVPHYHRDKFVSIYRVTHSFQKAADASLKKDKVKVYNVKIVETVKSVISIFVPNGVKERLRKFFKNGR